MWMPHANDLVHPRGGDDIGPTAVVETVDSFWDRHPSHFSEK